MLLSFEFEMTDFPTQTLSGDAGQVFPGEAAVESREGRADIGQEPGATSILGVDVGGVLTSRAADDADTSFFGSQPMLTPAVEGAFDVLTRLAAGPFAGRIHVVSKCGERIAALSRAWLDHHGFFERTGIPVENLHFVRRRPDKAPVCARLGITHFVDDRVDVLVHMTTVAHRYLFLGDTPNRAPTGPVPPWVIPVTSWLDLADRLATSAAIRPSA